MEDAQYTRVGEKEPRKANVRFIFASQELLPIHGREKHLLAGARMIRRVPILPLQERRADIPSLFNYHLERALKQVRVVADPIIDMFSMFHYETLILDGFSDDNVKGLIDFAGDIAARVNSGTEPDTAIKEAFSKRYGTVYPTASLTDSNIVKVQRDTMEIKRPYKLPLDRYLTIEDSYRRHDGNVSAMERDLRNQGFKYSRQGLAKILDSMNLPRTRKPRK
jgi:DNA-binding NtrC family response regulator